MQEIFSNLKRLPAIVPSLHRAGSGMVGSRDSSLFVANSCLSRESSALLPLDSHVTPLDWIFFSGMEGMRAPSPTGKGKIKSSWKMGLK